MTARSSLKFLLELRHVADVIDALVEAAGEFGGDRLDGDLLVGDRRENHQQFGRRLRAVGLVHRHFGDEVAGALGGGDVPIDLAGVLHRRADTCPRCARHRPRVDVERRRDARNLHAADQFGMPVDEGLDGAGVGRLRRSNRPRRSCRSRKRRGSRPPFRGGYGRRPDGTASSSPVRARPHPRPRARSPAASRRSCARGTTCSRPEPRRRPASAASMQARNCALA